MPKPNARLFACAACALGISAWAQGPRERLPRFEDYPAPAIFKQKPAFPRFVSRDEREVKEDILFFYGSAEHPDFAGHYIVILWPCGTECTRMAIIDAKTGTIYPPPLTRKRFPYGLPIAGTDYEDPVYRLNSKLFLLRHGCPEGVDHPCYDYYFVWDNNNFRLVRQVPVKVPKNVYIDPKSYRKNN